MSRIKHKMIELRDVMQETLFDEAHDAWHMMEDDILERRDDTQEEIYENAKAILAEEGFDEEDFLAIMDEDIYDMCRDIMSDAWNY